MDNEGDAESFYDAALAQMRSESPDTLRVATTLKKAIAAGSPHAAYALATWYLHGKDGVVQQDYAEAVRLLELAADAHHPEALYDLAVCYSNGEGVEKNSGKGFELFLQAALHGDADAVFKVGQAYFYGDGVAQDRRAADIWLDRAHELGTYESEPGSG